MERSKNCGVSVKLFTSIYFLFRIFTYIDV